MDIWNEVGWLLPQLILILFVLLLPAMDYLFRNDKRPLAWITLVPLLTLSALVVSWLFFGEGSFAASKVPYMQVDAFSGLFMLVFLVVGIVVVLSSPEFIKKDKNQGEYYALILLAITGMTVVAEAVDLIALFVGLEIAGISSFALAGFRKSEKRSSEAATRYFIIGGFSSALTLFSISLFYGVAGTTNIAAIAGELAAPSAWITESQPMLLLALVLLIAGLGFKIAMVPFHMWAPDVYEGAPTPISGLLAAASKKMGFAALFRVFLIGVLAVKTDWEVVIGAMAIITMTVGNLIAVSQTNIKRMLAYSSVAQAGYIMIALPVGTEYALAGGMFHILTHAFMKSGAFMVVAAMGVVMIGEKLDDFKGLNKRSPFLAFAMTIFLLSLAGIPPLAGFASKFVLFSSAVYTSLDPGPSWLIWLAIAGVLNSALSLYYYARVIKYMYMDKGPEETVKVPPMTAAAIVFALAMVFIIGLFPDQFVSVCQDAAGAFPGLPFGGPE
jgi:NADH-quinone oxidoreductase subunit N